MAAASLRRKAASRPFRCHSSAPQSPATPPGKATTAAGLWIPAGTIDHVILSHDRLRQFGLSRRRNLSRQPRSHKARSPPIDSTLSGNKAAKGGGGDLQPRWRLVVHAIDDCRQTPRSAQGNGGGGGIFSRSADVALTNSSLSGNSSTNGRGGGLYMTGGDFTRNGRDHCRQFRQHRWWRCLRNARQHAIASISCRAPISGNTSVQRTAGIYLRGIATIRNSTITNNSVQLATSVRGRRSDGWRWKSATRA